MPLIGITTTDEKSAARYAEAVQAHGADSMFLTTGKAWSPHEVLLKLHGLLLSGGHDIDPKEYGAVADPAANVRSKPERDAFELPLIRAALVADMPMLAICRGMQALNVAAGGKLLQDIPNHLAHDEQGHGKTSFHHIWISPGSKLAASIGSGGQVRVSSFHHQGLREAQKAPNLKASAYSPEDFIIEGLESPDHTWVVGVQFHPERKEELPKHFQGLFDALVYFAGKRAAAVRPAARS